MAQNSVTHQKIKKVPEVEASVDERLSANGSQKWPLSKSRENEALMESQAVPAWANTVESSALQRREAHIRATQCPSYQKFPSD